MGKLACHTAYPDSGSETPGVLPCWGSRTEAKLPGKHVKHENKNRKPAYSFVIRCVNAPASVSNCSQ